MALTVVQPGVGGTGNANLTFPNVTGTVMVSGNMPTFCYTQNSTTAVSSATFTKVNFQAANFDTTSGMYSSSRFTPTIAGYYQINGGVGVATVPTRVIAAIYRSGSIYSYGNDCGAATTVNTGITSGIVYCNGTTDYVEMWVYFGTGQNTAASVTQTYFSGAMVRTA